MQRLAIPELFTYAIWQSDRNVFFNSYFVRRSDGNVLVDPLAPSEDDVKAMSEMGGVSQIVVTNRDHERASRSLSQTFGAKIAAGAGDAPLLSGPVDRVLRDGEEAFSGATVIELSGLKSPGEIALHLRTHNAAIVGDALWGDPAGTVRLLPDAKLLDPRAAVLSLRKLWALELDILLVGDGASILAGADKIIGDYLQSRADAWVNRINLDEIEAERFSDAGGKYRAAEYEVGLPIGARKLGYQFVTLEPRALYCPLHSHEMEEEMFLVWEGRPSIRTPRGTFACRRGDVIAFPVGDIGAHQLLNESDKPATVFLLGADERNEVAYYPDSDKVLVRARRLRLRATPKLDYYDGE